MHPRACTATHTPSPRLVIALHRFDALCGFVGADQAVAQCSEAGAPDIAEHVRGHGVADTARAILNGALFAAPTAPSRAMQQLNEHHHDPRSAVALLMHHLRLAPGEALFLDAGCVHAYLSGLALEVQGSSDNVLRAAFTNKHVNLAEFFAVANLSPTGDARVDTETISAITTAYRSPAPFSVMRHEVNGAFSLTTTTEHTILMCTSGSAGTLTRGSGAYLASNETVELHGTATLYSVST